MSFQHVLPYYPAPCAQRRCLLSRLFDLKLLKSFPVFLKNILPPPVAHLPSLRQRLSKFLTGISPGLSLRFFAVFFITSWQFFPPLPFPWDGFTTLFSAAAGDPKSPEAPQDHRIFCLYAPPTCLPPFEQATVFLPVGMQRLTFGLHPSNLRLVFNSRRA